MSRSALHARSNLTSAKNVFMALLVACSMTSRRAAMAFAPQSPFLAAAVSSRRWVPNALLKTALSSSTSNKIIEAEESKPAKAEKMVPITLLSGFLGSGKTCTLQHLLENTDNVKIGVIVNDVASVNIDAKLVSANTGGVIELQNGCACCTLADELITSVENLLDNGRDSSLDAVVVELSGVADPLAIKKNWELAKSIKHPVTQKADVSRIVTLVDSSTFGTDWMTWDIAEQREGWVQEGDDCAGQRQVPELLAEQIEAADVILLNKIDIAGDEQVGIAASLVKSLNSKAVLETVEYGRVSPSQILREQAKIKDDDTSSSSCSDPDCTSSSHEHSHKHSHDHEEDSSVESSCSDPDCTDTSHFHSHSHSHATSVDQLGITNFVYKSELPFYAPKLMELLNQWPVPVKDELDLEILKEAQETGYGIDGFDQKPDNPFVGVLRSKGFCWIAPTRWSGSQEDAWRHETAMYWSHAGKHFGISTAGKWWGSITKEQMKNFFKENPKEMERIIQEDFVSEEFGDRRQEIVFIGVNLNEEAIKALLDECLLTRKGMERYRQEARNYQNRLLATSTSRNSGLLNANGIDHMDV